MIVVGPEDPLAGESTITSKPSGAKAYCRDRSFFAQGAQLEGSKEFAKGFMMRHNILTACYKSIT